jgi:AsmA protein
MKNKKLFVIAGIVVGVLLVVLVVLPLVINVDQFRPQIQAQISSALGRKVEIGKLSLSLLSGGVTASDMTISDDPAYSNQPFLKAKTLDVGVDLMGMIFSRSLSVRSITLEKPELQLLRTASGKWNFSSIGNANAAPTPAPRGRGKKSEPPQATNPSSGTTANVSVGELKIKNGRVVVGTVGRGKQYVYDDVNLTASDVSFDSKIPFTFDAKTPGGGSLKADGTVGPINRTDASATPLQANLKIEHMDLASTGFVDPSSGLGGVLDYTGTVKSNGKQAHSEGLAKVDKLRVVKSGQPARQPISVDYATDYDVARESGTLTKGDIKTGNSIAKLSGDYFTKGDATTLRMKLKGDSLPVNDIQGVLPAFGVVLPKGASLSGGTATANLGVDGPIDRLVTSGAVNVSNTKLSGYDLKSHLPGPLMALAGVHTGSDTIIQTMASGLRIAPEGIQTSGLNIVVPDVGTITGDGVIGANNALNFKMLAKLANANNVVGGVSQLVSFGQQKGEVPFLIQGTTSNPIFLPDMGRAITGTAAAPVKGATGLFGGIFGKKQKQ